MPRAKILAPSASKEELEARVDKLKRANALLRAKNKELKRVITEMAEILDQLSADKPVDIAFPLHPNQGNRLAKRRKGRQK